MICKRINNKVLVYGGSYFPENEPLKTSKVQSNRIYVYDDEFKLLYEQEGKIYPDKGIVIHENNIIYYIQSSSIYKISLTGCSTNPVGEKSPTGFFTCKKEKSEL